MPWHRVEGIGINDQPRHRSQQGDGYDLRLGLERDGENAAFFFASYDQ